MMIQLPHPEEFELLSLFSQYSSSGGENLVRGIQFHDDDECILRSSKLHNIVLK